MGFILYNLATHPRCQEVLHDELKKLLPRKDSPFTLETLDTCTYLKRVVKESLRLNPISVGVARWLTKDGVIGGFHIPEKVRLLNYEDNYCFL